MKQVVMVIAQSVFRDEEYATPLKILTARGAHVTTASTRVGPCTGKLGMRAEAQISLHDASLRNWDAVVFVGGSGAQVFFDDPYAHQLARRAVEGGRVAAAICVAPSVLAHAGLLHARDATAFPSQEADLRLHGARWTGTAVAVHGRIVTANGPEASREFADTVADLLELPRQEAHRTATA